MKRENVGPFKQTFSFDHCSGRFLREESTGAPLFDSARRFSCVFLSASAKDAARLNNYLSAAGIRAYHASDTREAEVLFAITHAKILLVDIDRMFEGWQEILQRLDESHPDVPKVILTAQGKTAWPLILSHFAFDVVSKPANLGDLLGALENAHSIEEEINDPEGARAREIRVMAAIRSALHAQTTKRLRPKMRWAVASILRSIWHAIRVRLSAMMSMVIHVWWKLGRHRTREQDVHA